MVALSQIWQCYVLTRETDKAAAVVAQMRGRFPKSRMTRSTALWTITRARILDQMANGSHEATVRACPRRPTGRQVIRPAG